jgi:predicted RecA/RadA family phage recombinase
MKQHLQGKARLTLLQGLLIFIALFAINGRSSAQTTQPVVISPFTPTIMIGDQNLPIPGISGEANYKYTETNGVSSLTPVPTGNDYNIHISTDQNSRINLLFNGVTVTKTSHISVIDNNGSGSISGMLDICSCIFINGVNTTGLETQGTNTIANSNGTSQNTAGIFSLSKLELVNRENLYVSAPEATSYASGILCTGDLKLDGTGLLKTTGYFGIKMNGIFINTSIKSGTVIVQGSQQAIMSFMAPDLSSYEHPAITASTIGEDGPYVAYVPNSFSTYKYVRVASVITIGNAVLDVPLSGTNYYTYSETGGVSSLAAGSSANYNVAVTPVRNGKLDLTLKDITVKAHSTNVPIGSIGDVNSALFIGYVADTIAVHTLGNNTLTGADDIKVSNSSAVHSGFYVNLKIINEGTLTLAGGKAEGMSSGIFCLNKLILDNATAASKIYLSGGETDNASSGIIVMQELNILGNGYIKSIGGKAQQSSGILSSQKIVINTQGKIEGIAKDGDVNMGLDSKQLIIQSGEITLQGIDGASHANPDLSAYKSPNMEASRNIDGNPLESYNPDNWYDFKYLHIYAIRDLAQAHITLPATSIQANGSQLKPAVTVVMDGTTLTEGTDYTVTYGENVKPGQGTVTVTGIGNYSGSQTIVFTLFAKPVYVIISKVDGVSVNPGFGLNLSSIGSPFEFTVTPDAALGKEGTDFTLEVRTDKGETLYPNGNSYKIAAVDHETTVYINVTKLHTTGVETLSTLTVYGGQGSIAIVSPMNTTALIVNLTGKVVTSTKIVAGKTTFSGLQKGIYIVKAGTLTTKVVVK